MQLRKLLMRPIKILGIVGAIVYPILVFIALQSNISIRVLGLWLLFVVLIAVVQRKNFWIGLCGIIVALMAIISDQEIFLKIYPVIMNLTVCIIFTASLYNVPLVKYFAKKMNYEIDDNVKKYTRCVTIVWAWVMGINTLISFLTVFLSDWIWVLYNGLISYCLIGAVMGIEYLVRMRVMHERYIKK